MHKITVEIYKAHDKLTDTGWQELSGLRRSQDIYPGQDKDNFLNLYTIMERKYAENENTWCRTASRLGVVYEFAAFHAYEAGQLMTAAGFSGWDASELPTMSMVTIRISME